MSQSLEYPPARPRFRHFGGVLMVVALLLAAGMALRISHSAAEGARTIPAPVLDEPANVQATSELAILAGGCFWGVQGVFQHVEGVSSAVSGYAGGAANTAHYEMVGFIRNRRVSPRRTSPSSIKRTRSMLRSLPRLNPVGTSIRLRVIIRIS